MALTSNRAKYLSVALLAVSFLFFIFTFILGQWSGFAAITSIGWYLLATAQISFVLLVQFHLRTMAEQEKLDMSRLAGETRAETIFAEQEKHADLFAVAQKRLDVMEKWFIPIMATVIAVYEVIIGAILLYALKDPLTAEITTRQPLLCSVFLIAMAFAAFLLSRYATGMSTEIKYKPLRAAGSHLLGAAVLSFIVAVCLALVQFQFPLPIKIVTYIIPALLILLGIETAANLILDIYRPRLKGQYNRSAFDSRLLGVISEPGEVLNTAAGAIDYQFGFQVSQTWFYQLLSKAVIPLMLFSALVLYLLSCIVVIEPQEKAIIERFGNPKNSQGQVRLLDAGIHAKLPWPIDIAYKYPTEKIEEIYIGYEPQFDPQTKLAVPERHLIWGQQHYKEEYDLVVSSPQSNTNSQAAAVPVSIVKANIPVQYKVKSLYNFLYNHKDPKKLLDAICYRELTKFAASAKVEVDLPEELQNSILGAGREKAKNLLTERIQAEADNQGLGINLVFVGLQGIHPPPKVATDYQRVVASVQKKEAEILEAERVYNRTLSNLAGSVEYAEKLYQMSLKLEDVENTDSENIERITTELDDAFIQASGDIFKTLAEAQSYAFEKTTISQAESKRFADQIKPYKAAPNIYRKSLRLEVFEQIPQNIRKYVVIADPNDAQVYIVDVKEALTPSLYDISGLEAP